MKVAYVSDTHLDVSGFLDLPGGELLILAGDICETRSLTKEFHQTKLVDRVPGQFACYDFFHSVVPKYEKVLYVLGNHEHYGGRLDRTRAQLESLMPSNVTILENQCVEHNGVVFMGSTLWTDCNKKDPLTMWTVKNGMNDYLVITNYYKDKNLYHKLTPQFTVSEHEKTLRYFRSQLDANPNKTFVIVTHHAPSTLSVPQQFKYDYHMNGGYVSDLSQLMLDFPNIRSWIHGHVHDPVDYMIGQTRVLCNPRGYLPGEANNGFDPCRYFEIAV